MCDFRKVLFLLCHSYYLWAKENNYSMNKGFFYIQQCFVQQYLSQHIPCNITQILEWYESRNFYSVLKVFTDDRRDIFLFFYCDRIIDEEYILALSINAHILYCYKLISIPQHMWRYHRFSLNTLARQKVFINNMQYIFLVLTHNHFILNNTNSS